ncbi:HYC_CC_PP family protein [Sinomicrobium weinanense]|uniref:Secreted protein n=1 Tax=Sinomicrobium weinanense TaxID=2842200 RepID=A0A926JR54_9FLAO|nr:hypothetical protein [Sinomicrobium weinanense]MBC9795928.1 hypothetical protein [Sinomicrobium weinanense]MBU3124693.1 hypothetical protein [Sinomicrobium weinanense]
MKKFFLKITSLLLTFLVLLSTVSFTVEKHFCGSFLVDTALFVKADSCGMVSEHSRSMEIQQSEDDSSCTIAQSPCCSEETVLIEGQDTLQKAVDTELHQQVVFLKAFVYTYLNLFEGLEENVVPFRDYSPPMVVRDIQVLNDTFLI